MLTTHAEGQPDTVPTRGYTNLFLLPKPIPALNGGGFARTVALSGGVGKVFLFNHEPGPGGAQRLLAKGNARPRTCPPPRRAKGASGVVLPDGRLCSSTAATRGHRLGQGLLLQPHHGPVGRAAHAGHSRIYGDALWLPDGA